MSKHTPGRWWADSIEVGAGPSMQVKIAKVGGATYEEAKANAKLLAAAPELLEALQALTHAFQYNVSVAYTASCVRDAEAAIAKATGGES